MDITGTVHSIGHVQQVTDKFSKRELIVAYGEGEYIEYLKFDLLQDKTKLADTLVEGEQVTVHFNLRGRPWTNSAGTTTYFNSLVAWKIEVSNTPKVNRVVLTNDDEDDDLPF